MGWLSGCVIEAPPADEEESAPAAAVHQPSACKTHDDCAAGTLCRFSPGSCGEASGSCEPVDAQADAECGVAVCGCDGRDYASACEAWKAGVSVGQYGSCGGDTHEPPVEPPPSCAGATCGAGEFCLYVDGSCGGGGACTSYTASCTSAIEPVCGCDGQTYDSRCEALRAGVSLQHDGPC